MMAILGWFFLVSMFAVAAFTFGYMLAMRKFAQDFAGRVVEEETLNVSMAEIAETPAEWATKVANWALAYDASVDIPSQRQALTQLLNAISQRAFVDGWDSTMVFKAVDRIKCESYLARVHSCDPSAHVALVEILAIDARDDLEQAFG